MVDALFVRDGAPVRFCLHKSVTQGRSQITQDVERHGGQIVENERYSDVLLIDGQLDIEFFRRRYYSSTDLYRHSLYIEPRGFVQACVRSRTYRHAGPVKRGMPGRARGKGVGRLRVPFTEEDRELLAHYIATRCPTREGRMGNSAYKDLERLGQSGDPSWKWARRHTFHSWREHYKMNPEMMDIKIDYYTRLLKGVGHHFGHDLRSREHARQRREEEQEEEEEEEEEQEEQMESQGTERRNRERGHEAQPAVVGQRHLYEPASDYLRRHERDLETSGNDEEGDDTREEGGEDAAEQELQRVKRHRAHPNTRRQHVTGGAQAKRPRITRASLHERPASDEETGQNGSTPTQDKESQEIEGSDLFGDHDYASHEYDAGDVGFPVPFSPQIGLVPEQDGPLLSTQETLAVSPRVAEREPYTLSAKEVRSPAARAFGSLGPPSSQTLIMTQRQVEVQHRRARVHGASAQPGPSMSKGMRTREDARALDAPYRNTRARSRSVEPQSWSQPNQGVKGKGKAMEEEKEVFVPIEEDSGEELDKEDAPTGGTGEGDSEIAVQGMLGDGRNRQDGRDEESQDNAGDILLDLPRFQEIEIESEPSDSDDAETHGDLVRGVDQEGTVEQDEEQDDEEHEDDAERVERMARGGLLDRVAPSSPQPRITRSKAAMETIFPSPGTKARAVVDRFQEEERVMPYAPPPGSRAARAVRRGRGD